MTSTDCAQHGGTTTTTPPPLARLRRRLVSAGAASRSLIWPALSLSLVLSGRTKPTGQVVGCSSVRSGSFVSPSLALVLGVIGVIGARYGYGWFLAPTIQTTTTTIAPEVERPNSAANRWALGSASVTGARCVLSQSRPRVCFGPLCVCRPRRRANTRVGSVRPH